MGSTMAGFLADVLTVVVWALTAGIGLLTLARTFLMKLLVFTRGERSSTIFKPQSWGVLGGDDLIHLSL